MLKERFNKEMRESRKKSQLPNFYKRLSGLIKRKYLDEPTIFLNRNPKYLQWQIGDYTYGSRYGSPRVVHYGEPVRLQIGKFCSFADNVTLFLGGNHRMDWVSTFPFSALFEKASEFKGHPASKGDIIIGNDVWVGEGASILSGVNIGNGAVIGAEALVVSDIPAYAIVGGNPAKIIRNRFEADEIESLERIAWWNWEIEKIEEALPMILQSDITEFIRRYSG